MHFKSDGNGGFKISKSAMAFATLLLIILGAIIPLVFGYGVLNNKVDSFEDDSKTIQENELEIALTSQRLEAIEDNIEEIKTDIKSIANSMKEVN